MKRGALVALVALVAAGLVPACDPAAGAGRYAYYLFLADPPQGCEGCYVPASGVDGIGIRRSLIEVLRLLEKPEGTVPILMAAFCGQR